MYGIRFLFLVDDLV